MSFYINRIKYKGGSPTFGASSGIINNAIINGYSFYDEYNQTPEIDYSQEYFTITSWEDGNVISWKHNKLGTTSMYYSLDKENWTDISASQNSSFYDITTINKGEKIYFKGINTQLGSNDGSYNSQFKSTKYAEISGNIMSMLYEDNFIGQTTASGAYTFINLFTSWTKLVSARNLVLPCTTYNQWIYQYTFGDCTNLMYAPKELPKQTSQSRNTLVWMFRNCYRLQETPVIRLTSNASGDGWYQMFYNDSSLKRVICLMEGTNISVQGSPWLTGVSTSGIFYKKSTSTWSSSNQGCPYSWTKRDFDTLEEQDAFISVWAEPDVPYTCFIEGCSDYFISGDTVTLKATAISDDFDFTGWYENGVLVSSDATYTFTASVDRRLTAKMTVPQQYTISVNVNDATMGSATGGGTYYNGRTATLVATAASNAYRFVGWYSNGSLVSSNASYTITVTGDATYEARFEAKQQYTIDVNVNDSSMGSATGGGTYYDGDSVTLVAATSSNAYRFVGWYRDGSFVSSNTSLSLVVNRNMTYEARFEAKQQYTVTLSVNDATMGSATGGGTYYDGDSVTLVAATTSNAYRFVGWYSNGSLVSSNTNFSFVVHSSITYEARFEAKQQYTVTLSVNDATMGSATGGGTYYDGDSVTLVATRNSGYAFIGWYDNGTLVSRAKNYTFTITGNISYVATFEVSTYQEVSWLTSTASYDTCYFDTGINTTATSSFVVRMKFIMTRVTGNVTFGHFGTSDYNDCRLFLYSGSSFYCDCGNGRAYNFNVTYDNSGNDWTWTINFSSKTYNVYNNKTSSQLCSGTFATNPASMSFLICPYSMKFQGLTITVDGVDVFDGIPVLDNSDSPCVYDYITNNFFYAQGSNASSITYG